jgi:hypothetical protein
MSDIEPKESRFEPTLLLALIVMVGIALGKDVFYDIMSQAIAMIGLSILVIAFVLPLMGLVEMFALKRSWRGGISTETPLPAEETPKVPKLETEVLSSRASAAKPNPERNAGSAGVRVLCGALHRNDNKGWNQHTYSSLRSP